MDGRALTVNVAKPREERTGGAVAVVVNTAAAVAVMAAVAVATNCPQGFQGGVRVNRTSPLRFLSAFSWPDGGGRAPSQTGYLPDSRMREQHIEVEGCVTTVLPGTMFVSNWTTNIWCSPPSAAKCASGGSASPSETASRWRCPPTIWTRRASSGGFDSTAVRFLAALRMVSVRLGRPE